MGMAPLTRWHPENRHRLTESYGSGRSEAKRVHDPERGVIALRATVGNARFCGHHLHALVVSRGNAPFSLGSLCRSWPGTRALRELLLRVTDSSVP
jgi:hypothetical protein